MHHNKHNKQSFTSYMLRTNLDLKVNIEVPARDMEHVNVVPKIFEVKPAAFPELCAIIDGWKDQANADGDQEALTRYLLNLGTQVRASNIQGKHDNIHTVETKADFVPA